MGSAVLFALRRLPRSASGAASPFAAAIAGVSSSSAPLRPFEAGAGGRAGEGSGRMETMVAHSSTADAWNADKPRLGSWPNIEVGVPRPDTVTAPEPTIFVKETKHPIVGGYTDTDLIMEYDRVRGTSDLNDNASISSAF
ncbi:hypothetical protein HYH03_013533 [Edaphochlamys debaryana]|uniref:Uncharacterized protein n=1 Tax=Edaphochlamys debaryana TaxID=47281 RepID=A0A835XYF0_9CHLO|nr:hypothetical protein HYH03_013533 [Edaphochlamys debaryana]|eukprot:KAG2487954.1 hypothetical protein HYH03_013533 [Edaphochlamys debaryana]